jgi:hypothetical protein
MSAPPKKGRPVDRRAPQTKQCERKLTGFRSLRQLSGGIAP